MEETYNSGISDFYTSEVIGLIGEVVDEIQDLCKGKVDGWNKVLDLNRNHLRGYMKQDRIRVVSDDDLQEVV